MNLKESIFQHLSSLQGFSSSQVFQDSRSKDDADLDNILTRDFHVVFFNVNQGVGGKIRDARERFEFHFLGHKNQEDTMETARDIFRESIENFSGLLGGVGGLLLHGATYDNAGETVDWETNEKTLVCQASFYYIKPPAGTI